MTKPPPASPPTPSLIEVDILPVESGRLLGRGEVRTSPDGVEAYRTTVFGIDRDQVVLQFDGGVSRDVSLSPRPGDRRFEYLVVWDGRGQFVPASVQPAG